MGDTVDGNDLKLFNEFLDACFQKWPVDSVEVLVHETWIVQFEFVLPLAGVLVECLGDTLQILTDVLLGDSAASLVFQVGDLISVQLEEVSEFRNGELEVVQI